jgi:iron(III) transport system substrate-binding protein
MINHKGEKYTKKWLRNVRKNLVKSPQGNDRSQVKSIWAGECDISLGNTYYMGIMQNDSSQKKWAESVRIIFPVFQGGGTHINVSGVAIAAHAPNRDDAMKLIRFFMEKDTQAIYAHKNFEYPVIDGVKLSKQVKSWGDFTPDAMSLFDIANVRSDALSLVEKIGFDK